MVREAIVERLAAIRQRLHALPAVLAEPLPRYATDALLHSAGERWLQLLVEAASDVSRLLLAGMDVDAETTSSASFRRLAEEGIIPHDLADVLQGYTKTRNIIVHDYLDIDHADVYGKLERAADVFGRYALCVEKALTAQAAGQEETDERER